MSFINNIMYYNGLYQNECQVYCNNINTQWDFYNNDIMFLDDPNCNCNILGGNNVDILPEFIDPATNNYRLFSYSQLIDMGLSSVLPVALVDLEQQNRITNTIDIGAYEYNGMSPKLLKPELNLINIYPNPAVDYLCIETVNDFNSVDIMSLDGKSVLKSTSPYIDISMLSSGMYMIQVRTIEGNSYHKFTKK